jgi:hypothetical protein
MDAELSYYKGKNVLGDSLNRGSLGVANPKENKFMGGQ